VDGVALATTLSQAVSAVLVVWTLMRRTDSCHLNPRQIRPHKPQLLRILRIGLPAGLQGCLFSISNVIIQSSVNSFGEAAVAGSAAASNIGVFPDAILTAFSQTATNYTGQNVGAGQPQRVRRIFGACCLCTIAVGIVTGSCLYLGRNALLRIYITDSPEAMFYGVLRLTYMYVPILLGGLMNVATGSLRGLGSSLAPMLMSVLGVCGIRLVWIFTIFQDPRFHSMESLLISYPISWTLTFLVETVAFVILYRRWVRNLQAAPAKPL
jgi:Na+-driven multidrug efflux pump